MQTLVILYNKGMGKEKYMNTDDGSIRELMNDDIRITGVKDKEDPNPIRENDIPVTREQMTPKQRVTMQVSKYDSISVLGRLYTGCRKDRRARAKELKRVLKHKKKETNK
jgi:hypothetical protein